MMDRRMWIIFLIIFVNMLGFGIILPLLPYYVESLGAGPMMIGLVSAAYSLFQLISAPVLGELSDTFGRRPVLLFSIAGTAVSFILLGFAQSLPLIFLSRIIDGISGGNISTAQAYIADITTKENRTQGMGIMMAAFGLGFIIGPAFGGLLSVYGYAVPAYVAGGVAAIATILTYLFLPETQKDAKRSPSTARRRVFRMRDFYDALTHPNVGLYLTISFLTMFAFSLMQGTFALFTEHALKFSATTNGLVFAYIGLIGILVQLFFLKPILRSVSERKATVISTMMMAIALGLIALSTNLYILIIAVTILALANSVSGPVLAGLISKNTPDTEQGNIAGMNQSVGSMARLFGPIAGTSMYSLIGLRAPYILATAVVFLTSIYGMKKLRLFRQVVH